MTLPHTLKLLLDKEVFPTLMSRCSINAKINHLHIILSGTEWNYEIFRMEKKIIIFIKVNDRIYKVSSEGIRKIA